MKPTRNVRLGRICKKHPELNGLRYVGNSCCTECCIQASRKHYANLELTPAQKITTLLGEVAKLKAENEAIRKTLAECTDSLHAEMLQKFGGQLPGDMHPVTRREYDRDMAEVSGYRAAMSSGEQS